MHFPLPGTPFRITHLETEFQARAQSVFPVAATQAFIFKESESYHSPTLILTAS